MKIVVPLEMELPADWAGVLLALLASLLLTVVAACVQVLEFTAGAVIALYVVLTIFVADFASFVFFSSACSM